MSVQPITPEEALVAAPPIPDAIIQIFNDLIVENLRNRSARFSLTAVTTCLQLTTDITVEEATRHGWFDVESAYRNAGWIVTYDQPGFNEPGHAQFHFMVVR